MQNIRLIANNKNAILPQYATPGAAGADVRAAIDQPVTLMPGERLLVPTGWDIAIPKGTVLDVRPRSGTALKNGITVANSPGTIDEDYRGPLGVILINNGQEAFTITPGDRIAQIVLLPVLRADFVKQQPGTRFEDTERGQGGFGSTGRN